MTQEVTPPGYFLTLSDNSVNVAANVGTRKCFIMIHELYYETLLSDLRLIYKIR
jgi:hypothetical protein